MKKGFLVFVALVGISNCLLAQTSAKQAVQKVVTSYLAVKDALADDDSVKAKTAAIGLCDAIEKVSLAKLSSSEKKSWTKLSDNLLKDAQKIKDETTLDDQRKNFEKLSESLYKLLGDIKIKTITLYYQYCETAKAHWISSTATIRNPYLGKKMLDCGYTEEMMKGKGK